MISFKDYINLDEVASPAPQTTQQPAAQNYSASLQKGGNPMIYTLWNTLKPKYPNIKSYGIWGDKAHQQRKSDHNTGDAIDIGVSSAGEGNNIVRDVIAGNSSGPYKGYIKYIIFNRQIWNPSQGTRPYSGSNPHTTHVHVSFNRAAGSGGGNANQWPGGGETAPGQQPGTQSATPGGGGGASAGAGGGGGGGAMYQTPGEAAQALIGGAQQVFNPQL